MTFKITISDPKGREAWQVEKDWPTLIGKTVGERVDGSPLGLDGYTLEITGGSDEDGFPMRKDLPGTDRKKVMLSKGTGYNPKEKGVRRKKSVRGNTISEEIVQVNTKVVERESDVEEIPKALGLEIEEESSEEKSAEEKQEEEGNTEASEDEEKEGERETEEGNEDQEENGDNENSKDE